MFVSLGRYPPLPEVAMVDTSLLREEVMNWRIIYSLLTQDGGILLQEEWGLVLRYILHFPVILQEAAEIKTSCVGLRGQSGLKKVTHFHFVCSISPLLLWACS